MSIASPPLDTIAADAERLSGALELSIPTPGQLWIILPDGALPGSSAGPCSLASMKLPDKRHAVLLARQVFLKTGACALIAGNRRILLEFQPSIIAGRTKEGKAYARTDTSLALTDSKREPEPETLPDPGELLEGLQKSTKTLEAIDDLLTDPAAIASEDPETRAAVQDKLISAKDKALAGLGQLGAILAEGDGGDREAWMARVAEASSTMVEEMADLDGLPEEAKAGKLKALDDFKRTVARYFASVDPNSPVVRKFSAGISELVLKERREVVQSKKSALEKDLEETYSALISLVQAAVPKGGGMSLLPLPRIEVSPGSWGRIVFNMCHLVMAVQHGGFHMRLDVDPRNRRAWDDCRPWEEKSPPQVHIVSRSMVERGRSPRRAAPAAAIDPSSYFD